MVVMTKPKAIVLDLEGTTMSSKYFGTGYLPYIKTHTKKCLKERWGAPEVMEIVDRLRRRTQRDRSSGAKIPAIAVEGSSNDQIIRSVEKNVIEQINQKRHTSALIQIQILVGLYGYQTGELKTHVFRDVSQAFHNWKVRNGIKIYMFSSGSAVAQKLMFSCTSSGNLTDLISDFFDLEEIGKKTNYESYRKIAANIGLKASDILFLTDNPNETRAAKRAGFRTLLVIRPGNKEINDEEKAEFGTIESFLEIEFN
jgi:enolase-phosphatase E1